MEVAADGARVPERIHGVRRVREQPAFEIGIGPGARDDGGADAPFYARLEGLHDLVERCRVDVVFLVRIVSSARTRNGISPDSEPS